MGGPVHKYGLDVDLDGDLYMAGHPVVVDNELRVPDLEPTIETSSFLLKLKAAFDGDTIRDQARAALKLDIGERLRSVKEKLSTDLGFRQRAGLREGGRGQDRGERRARARELPARLRGRGRARERVPALPGGVRRGGEAARRAVGLGGYRKRRP